MAWSDPEINKLVTHFVAAAGEVGQLERGRDSGSRLFRKIATAHITGLQTTQGTYIVTPAGKLLTSGHSLEPLGIERLLRRGLKKWRELTPAERLGSSPSEPVVAKKSRYPEDGLVLSVVLHKFPKSAPGARSRRSRGAVTWNQDFAWYRKADAVQFVPKNLSKGARHDVPESVVLRLARFHFTDTVRAFADPYPKRCVEVARLMATVLERVGDRVSLRLEGAVRTSQSNMSRRRRGQRLPRLPQRGYDCTMLGYATFDLKAQRFMKFELVARGMHRGGGVRSGGGPVTMDVALTLADGAPMNRVEPRHLDWYRWHSADNR